MIYGIDLGTTYSIIGRGDKLYSDEYIYTFDKDHGWKVETADKERTEPLT